MIYFINLTSHIVINKKIPKQRPILNYKLLVIYILDAQSLPMDGSLNVLRNLSFPLMR